MKNLTEEFERRVSAFLQSARMSASEFGERALGDRGFCGDVRRGRSPTLATADRVLAFIAAYGADGEPDRPEDSTNEPGAGGPGVGASTRGARRR